MNTQYRTGFIIFSFAGALICLSYLDPAIAINNYLFIKLNSLGTFFSESILTFLTEFGNAAILLIASIIPICYSRKFFRLIISSTLIGIFLSRGLKILLDIPRPGASLTREEFFVIEPILTSQSVPSGHAFSLFLFLSCLVTSGMIKKNYFILLIFAFSFIAFTRVFVGAHWPMDILIGASLGFSLPILLASLANKKSKILDALYLLIFIILIIIAFYLILISNFSTYDFANEIGWLYIFILLSPLLFLNLLKIENIFSAALDYLAKINLFQSKFLKFFLPLIISSTFIYLIFQYGSFSSFLSMTENMDLHLLFVAQSLLVLSLLIRATRLRRFFKNETESSGIVRITFLHNFFNNFLPMRIGEFSFPLMLRESYSIDNKISLRALFIFRLTDLLSITSLSLFIFLGFYYSSMIIILITVAWYFGVSYLLQERDIEKNLFEKIEILIWSFLAWCIKIFALTFLLLSLVTVSLESSFVAVIFGELTSILPIHGFAGTGTYEGGIILGLNSFDKSINIDSMISASLLVHFTVLLYSLILAIVSKFIKKI